MKTDDAKKQFHVLILGASYGSLLGCKLLLAGHHATLVCRESTAALFNTHGSVVRIPIRGRTSPVEIRSTDLKGTLNASSPVKILLKTTDSEFDLVVLAMQEPQYSAPGVRELVKRIADSRIPTMAITNMPLLPYLRRIPGLDVSNDSIRSCFTKAALWDNFDDPSIITQCSPDPQAFRPPDEPPNVLVVRLPTNFKAARFGSEKHTSILRQLEEDIQETRWMVGDEQIQVPVKLRVYDSMFAPLAKWAMLLAGNYRCIQPYPQDMLSIKDAVGRDIEESRAVYGWVVEVCIGLGGDRQDFVPFDKYAEAAISLVNPSSAARALKDGARSIERVDKLVAIIAKQQGKQLDAVDTIVSRGDEWLDQNDKNCASA